MPGRPPTTPTPESCPFCDGRAEFKLGHYTGYVMCLGCEVMGPNLAEAEAVAAWNLRTPAASPSGVSDEVPGKPNPDESAA